MSSDQEKILLLQKEFHLSQLALKECGVELQKIRARLLQDLLDLEIYHHMKERKAYDMQVAQLKDQFDTARSEMEQIKLTKVAPLKARAVGTESVKDILSTSISEIIPEDIVTMEQEASVVISNTLLPQQEQVSLSPTVRVLSDEERTVHDCQGNTCSTEQTSDTQRWNSTEMASDTINNAAELKEAKTVAGKKNIRKKKVPVEITNEGDVTDSVSEIVECQSKEDMSEDVCTSVVNSSIEAEAVLGVDNDSVEDGGLNEHNCQQCLHEETVNNIPLAVTEELCDVNIPQITCQSPNSNVAVCEAVDTLAHVSGDGTAMTSTVPAENIVTKQTELDANTVKEQTFEESVTIHRDSIPAGIHDKTGHCCDASQLPNMHQEPPSNSSQGLALNTCEAACGEFSYEQNVNEIEMSQEMDVQEMDSNATIMRLEEQKKQKNASNKKGVTRKKKGRRRRRGKKIHTKIHTKVHTVDQVTVPDSTGIQNDCSIEMNTESVPVAVGNSETQSPPEPSVSSTSNGAANACVESSSDYRKATIHDDEEFAAVKKLKLENNQITSPSNLVTSTSSDNVENVRDNACSTGDDVSMFRPSSTTTESDNIASTKDRDNSFINVATVPSKGTSKPQGINRRKHQRPKKRQNTAVTMKTEKNIDDGVENNVVKASGDINHNVTNPTPLVDTTDAIEEASHELQEQPLQASTITTFIKCEPEASTLTTVPVTKNSKESAGVKAHGQKPCINKPRKLLSLKSLNRRLMPDISFKGTSSSSVIFNLHNITAPKLKPSVKSTLK